ncbi:MAG: MFS transporter [Chloroflexota bacterium]|nr:MAG: MFS transporter [Chloroflexota bacterium]
MNLVARQVHDFRQTLASYPPAFRTIFYGSLVQAAGVSMIWPFMTVYMRENLGVAVATVTLLITMENIIGTASTSISGMVVDKFGRKTAMVVAMTVSGLVLLGMSMVHTLFLWAALMAIRGLFDPMFGVSSSATVADLIPDEQRAGAYAQLRIAHNVGVAVGPAVGGLLIAISYTPVFLIGTAVTLGFALLIARVVPETLPRLAKNPVSASSEGEHPHPLTPSPLSIEGEQKVSFGYGTVLKDRRFVLYCLYFTLTVMTYLMVMTLLPVFMKDEYGIRESYFGIMMTINALMVVTIEFGLTKWVSAKFKLEHILAVGALTYALTAVIIVGSNVFAGFLIAMILMTVGEILMMPNSMTYVANLATEEARGRYMGVYGLTWRVGAAIGPLMGGLLNDHISPHAVWVAAAVFSFAAVVGFVQMARYAIGPASAPVAKAVIETPAPIVTSSNPVLEVEAVAEVV